LFAVLLLIVSSAALAGHHFNANAIAVSGSSGSAIGSVALPASGGEASSIAGPYDDGTVRFAEARSVVRGLQEGNVAVTTTEVVLSDVTIGDRVHADRLIVRTTGRHAADAREAEIRFEGSAIENLTIDGAAVDAALDIAWFDAHPTFASVVATGVAPHAGGITCSAYGNASCPPSGRGIRIAGLGVLTIGRIFIKDGARNIQLLSLDRGLREGRIGTPRQDPDPAPWRPPVVVGSSDTNGAPVWPRPGG
jgi:hypothetical protein